MKAIVTKYSTDACGRARILVSAESQKTSIPWDYLLDTDANHRTAALTFAARFGWSGVWIGGTLPDGASRVFVCSTGAQGFRLRAQKTTVK